MIRKITLGAVASLALLVLPAYADCPGGNCQKKVEGKSCNKGMKKGMKYMGSPLLLPLPPAMRWIEQHKENAKLALTTEQKKKLETQRNAMMPQMMKLKGQIAKLSKEIKTQCKKGISLEQIEKDVKRLSELKVQTTMLKMRCLRGVKGILSKEQWSTLKELKGSFRASKQGKKCN